MSERDPEAAIDDIGDELASGDEPSPDEQAFLEGEKVDVDRGSEPPGSPTG
jgi:hypothetical protein